ncbi:MAG: hypothetical protein WD381_02165 [Balneolaceae bacterium]
MESDGICLGVCYADNQLFYSVNDPENPGSLQHIGCFDFNFDVRNAVVTGDGDAFTGIKSSLEKLKEKFNCSTVRILSPAIEECWSIVPRSVYEEPEERESHIHILMHGIDSSNRVSTWYPLHNADYKLLLARNSTTMMGFQKLLGSFSNSEYVSEFEVGNAWQDFTQVNGSFLTIHCQKNYLSVSSHILGKLRGSTVIRFDNRTDLPYLWTLYSSKLSWMRGIHEQIYVYGQYAQQINEALTPFLDDDNDVTVMNTLQVMNVEAKEQTYGFRLEAAFPAVMLSLNIDSEKMNLHENHNG